MADTKILITCLAAFSCAAYTHPLSMDSLRPAPIHSARKIVPILNADILVNGIISSGELGDNDSKAQTSDSRVIAAQKTILNGLDFQAGECGTMMVMIEKDSAEPAIISQAFSIVATSKGTEARKISSGYSGVKPGTDVAVWLNAYDFKYRSPTQIISVAGAKISIGAAVLKTCPG